MRKKDGDEKSIYGMGVDLDNSSDKGKSLTTDDTSRTVGGQLADSTRRRFTRNAVMGSAVVLSLGNRTAWGLDAPVPPECLSVPTWESYMPGIGFTSFDPDNTDQAEKLAKAMNIESSGIDDTEPNPYPGYVCPAPASAGDGTFTDEPFSSFSGPLTEDTSKLKHKNNSKKW